MTTDIPEIVEPTLTDVVNAHRFWAGTRSNPWCSCGWDGPGENPAEPVGLLWIEHVHERLEAARRLTEMDRAYWAAREAAA